MCLLEALYELFVKKWKMRKLKSFIRNIFPNHRKVVRTSIHDGWVTVETEEFRNSILIYKKVEKYFDEEYYNLTHNS